ncbi:MAG: hypothetical protein WAT12_02680 [Candidatus Nitrotoga sp.]
MSTPGNPNSASPTRAKAAMMVAVAVARHIAYVPMSRAYYDKKRAQERLGSGLNATKLSLFSKVGLL